MSTIVLLALIALGILLMNLGLDFIGRLIVVITVFFSLYHLPNILTVEYRYGLLLAERNAFEQTLRQARENGNVVESAAILQKITDWNVVLAIAKYDNANWFFGNYIDDRVMELEPIK
jgi:hypothetical protein